VLIYLCPSHWHLSSATGSPCGKWCCTNILTAANLTGTILPAVLGNSTFHYTTAVALNRASANQVLTNFIDCFFLIYLYRNIIPRQQLLERLHLLCLQLWNIDLLGDTWYCDKHNAAGSLQIPNCYRLTTAGKVATSALTGTLFY
jgi:hypothetical protein